MNWWTTLWKYSLFEAADSAWSLIIVSTYFGTFLQVVLRQPGADFGWAVTLGALVIALLSPLLGAAADDSGRRQPYLRFFVAVVVVSTAALAWTSTAPMAMAVFVVAYICANGAFAIFGAMTPAVTDERSVEKIIGMTVGVGYAGGLVCLLTLGRLVPADQYAYRVFVPMAFVYLACAVPAMFIAPDFPRKAARLNVRAAYRRMRATIADARRYQDLFRFLIGDFLYENAVASVITLMGLYSRNVMGFTASELTSLFGPAIIVAMLSAWFVFAPLVRMIGPKKAVLLDLLVWLILFASVLLITPASRIDIGPLHMDAKRLFGIVVAPLAGIGLAGVWTASRVLLTALTPAEKSGEFWGLYNLSGRTASVLGDASWSAALTIFGEGITGYRIAVVALTLYVVAGALLIVRVADVRPTQANFLHVN